MIAGATMIEIGKRILHAFVTHRVTKAFTSYTGLTVFTGTCMGTTVQNIVSFTPVEAGIVLSQVVVFFTSGGNTDAFDTVTIGPSDFSGTIKGVDATRLWNIRITGIAIDMEVFITGRKMT